MAGARAGAAEPDAAREIHRATRNTFFGPVGRSLWPRTPPAGRSKDYEGERRIPLPEPAAWPTRPLAEVLESSAAAQPSSARESIELPELARLLHFTNGVTGRRGRRGHTFGLRAAPSAGALYAGEIYVVADRVNGLHAGVYYYDAPHGVLVPVRREPSFAEVEKAVEQPDSIRGAPAAFLLSNVFGRYGWRYANRGYRYALIDTGHIGENLRLTAGSAGLAEASISRFHDDRLNALLKIDGQKEAVCALHVWLAPAQDHRCGALRRRGLPSDRFSPRMPCPRRPRPRGITSPPVSSPAHRPRSPSRNSAASRSHER